MLYILDIYLTVVISNLISYLDLEESYLSGSLHPLDLKNGTAAGLYEVVKPMQDACESNSENYDTLISSIS